MIAGIAGIVLEQKRGDEGGCEDQRAIGIEPGGKQGTVSAGNRHLNSNCVSVYRAVLTH